MTTEPISLPFSEEAERGLLHCMTLKSVLETYSRLPAAVFYIPAHAIVFGHMRDMLEKDQALDFNVILDRVKVAKHLEEVGGKGALSDIWGFSDTSGDHEYYYGVVLDCYRRRVAFLELKELMAKLLDRRTDADASIQETVERTLTAISLSSDKKERTFRSIVLDTLDILEARHKDPGISGIKFGIPSLDSELYGLQSSEQCVIAGSTSSGKSALATQAVLENARKGGASAVFSLEMSATRVVTRMISHLGPNFDGFT
jgi:replicative DNA helicase